MNANNQTLLHQISQLPANWHGSGSMSPKILETILDYSETLSDINLTAETGAGKTTLLFSNISEKHIVFALDNWDSLSAAKNSSLLKRDNIEFVEGPTQRTLPNYLFNQNFDIVLLDGPHGYPFPDLEYFYFYPHIKVGGLLLIDDVGIPSITRMFEILKKDEMWDLVSFIEKLAIFRRTDAPLIDPFSDSWWLQGYNKKLHKKMQKKQIIKERIPNNLYSKLPPYLKKIAWKIFK